MIGHGANAGDKRGECSHNGDESGNNDGFASVFLKKVVGFNEVRGVENERFLVIKHPRTYLVANCVVEGVAQDGGREKHQKENVRGQGLRQPEMRAIQQRK